MDSRKRGVKRKRRISSAVKKWKRRRSLSSSFLRIILHFLLSAPRRRGEGRKKVCLLHFLWSWSARGKKWRRPRCQGDEQPFPSHLAGLLTSFFTLLYKGDREGLLLL